MLSSLAFLRNLMRICPKLISYDVNSSEDR